MMHATIDDWIKQEALPFTEEGIDGMMAALSGVEMLGFGEGLHGGEDILQLRNRLFRRLVEVHRFRSFVMETTFPQASHVDEYVRTGQGTPNFDEWISNGFGLLEANRELIEWMRAYNVHHEEKLRFYGFDMPLGKQGFGSPRLVLAPVLDLLGDEKRRQRIESLMGEDSSWEDPAVIADPLRAVGLTPAATELRIEVENLVTHLRIAQPGRSDALHYASIARQLLDAHAALARRGGYGELLGIRDAIMADNLEHIHRREGDRGRVMVFAHNGHLNRGQAMWRMGEVTHTWWPAGAHVGSLLADRYAVIGSGVGRSEENGIVEPELGTLEDRLAARGESLLISVQGAPPSETAALPIRTGSRRNPTYFPFTPGSFADFDWLAFVPSTTYQRGGPPLSAWEAQR